MKLSQSFGPFVARSRSRQLSTGLPLPHIPHADRARGLYALAGSIRARTQVLGQAAARSCLEISGAGRQVGKLINLISSCFSGGNIVRTYTTTQLPTYATTCSRNPQLDSTLSSYPLTTATTTTATMSRHHPDLVMCRKQAGIAIGRLCDKCDGKCPVCDSYVRPTTLVRICDECSFGNYQNKCVVCGGEGISDAFYCFECTRLEKDRDGCPKIINLGSSRTDVSISYPPSTFSRSVIVLTRLCFSL